MLAPSVSNFFSASTGASTFFTGFEGHLFTRDFAKSREGLKGTGVEFGRVSLRSAVPALGSAFNSSKSPSSSSSLNTYSSSSKSFSFESLPASSSAARELPREDPGNAPVPDGRSACSPASLLYALTISLALRKVSSSKTFSLRHRLSTRRTPGKCSGGHFKTAAMQVRISGAKRVEYNNRVSSSTSCVTNALITYSTGTLCLGFRAPICLLKIATACL